MFGTLNYECLFEQALTTLGLQFDYLLESAAEPFVGLTGDDWPGDRHSPNVVCVAKLHGSCNFTTPDEPILRVQLSSPSTYVETRIVTSDPFAKLTESGVKHFPIMTQISPGKEDFIAGAQIFQIRRIWEKAVALASLIVVIGVAPREYDSHVWNPLRNAAGDILYIGGASDYESWRRCNDKIVWLGSTFVDSFRPLLRRLALHKRRTGGSVWNYILNGCRWMVA